MSANKQQLIEYIKNHPLKVNFAGLGGTTLSMQRAGWQICVEEFEQYTSMRTMFRLAGRHPELNLRLLSGYFELDIHSIIFQHPHNFWHMIDEIVIPIAYCSEHITMVIPTSAPPNFRSVDFSNPEFVSMSRERFSLDDICPFKYYNDEVDVYIPENKLSSVNDYLMKVLDMQSNKQKELREKYRKGLLKEGKSDLLLEENKHEKNKDIKFQIISVN